MSRIIIRGAAAVSLVFTAACTQYPAPVALKGQNTFGRDGEQMVASSSSSSSSFFSAPAAPVAAVTIQETAPITISEIAPEPVKAAPEPQVQQQASAGDIHGGQQADPALSGASSREQQASAGGIQEINPWTGKPRTEFMKNKPEPKVASKNSNETKPVKLYGMAESSQADSFIWPVNGNKIISSFGPKGGGKANDGINIAASEGEPIWAVADGEVTYVGNEIAGYGNMVLIKHAGNKTTTYAHLSNATVDKYDRVKQGDIIGYVGTTGNVKNSQLHFAVRDGKDAVDPLKYLSRSVAGL